VRSTLFVGVAGLGRLGIRRVLAAVFVVLVFLALL
jgi:hypothetical protein